MGYSATEIRELRDSLGMTRRQLAKKVRVGVDSVRHWESGLRVPSPPVQLLLRLIEAGCVFDKYLVRHKNKKRLCSQAAKLSPRGGVR